MIIKMYSVYDIKTTHFSRPFVAENAVDASRSFACSCNDRQIQLSAFPSDFDLYEVGEMDTQTGIITDKTPKQFIIAGTSAKELVEASRKLSERKKDYEKSI